MACKTKSCNVSHSVDPINGTKLGSSLIQRSCRLKHLRIIGISKLALFKCRCVNTYAKRLAKDKQIASLCISISF